VLDLFSGAGGFSLGFSLAGFQVTHAIDYEPRIEKTFKYNHPKTRLILADIRKIDAKNFKDCKIVIGSPPCQDFSIAKQNRNPGKGMQLVEEYKRFIKTIKPEYWIMENVPPIKNHLNEFFPMIHVLNSADYGVPQARRRCFSGYYIYPPPTHDKFSQKTLDGKELKKWVSVKEAIGDLIPLVENSKFLKKFSLTQNQETHKFFKASEPAGTITTIPPRKIMNLEKIEASKEALRRKLNSGFGIEKRYNNFKLEKPSCTIIASRGGSPIIEIPRNGSSENNENKKYRILSIRECARLQSFPDSFIFIGSKTACYRMVGNAVPPLMSFCLASAIKREILKKADDHE
jgi:DNA (cytosine-5)-methyltransferase 1